jgi:hypothetical protein
MKCRCEVLTPAQQEKRYGNVLEPTPITVWNARCPVHLASVKGWPTKGKVKS